GGGVDPAGKQWLTPLRRPGGGLPRRGDTRRVDAVPPRRTPVVSDLVSGDLPERAHVVVAVPVLRHGVLHGALLTALDATTLARVLELQQLPSGWVAGIVDGHGVVVARTPNPEHFIGQPATPNYLSLAMTRDAGSARLAGVGRGGRRTLWSPRHD